MTDFFDGEESDDSSFRKGVDRTCSWYRGLRAVFLMTAIPVLATDWAGSTAGFAVAATGMLSAFVSIVDRTIGMAGSAVSHSFPFGNRATEQVSSHGGGANGVVVEHATSGGTIVRQPARVVGRCDVACTQR